MTPIGRGERGEWVNGAQQGARDPVDEARARQLAEAAVEQAGGSRMIYRSPRHPFAINPAKDFDIEGHSVEIRWGEISSPAIVSVAGYVFEITEEGIDILARPPKPRS